jgi:hypothetical protein
LFAHETATQVTAKELLIFTILVQQQWTRLVGVAVTARLKYGHCEMSFVLKESQ